MLKERWLTKRDEAQNVDSVATWHGGDQRHWLIATAKEGNVLQVFDASTGEPLQEIGGSGDGPGQFERPNGIAVNDDLVIVVERDNRRVQVLSLPDFTPIGSFGDGLLRKPYGLWVRPAAETGGYDIFVTDNYETADEEIPPAAQLDRRLHQFRFTVSADGVDAEHLGAFGATEGRGVLHKVESLWGDGVHGRLLVADELEAQANVKVYDLEGRFTGTVFGDEIFEYEPEGIALYACNDRSGFWLITDQDEDVNRFHAFDRKTLAHLGFFEGRRTRNTDGVWMTTTATTAFPRGAFYAVHDDGNVAAFDLGEILDSLGLDAC